MWTIEGVQSASIDELHNALKLEEHTLQLLRAELLYRRALGEYEEYLSRPLAKSSREVNKPDEYYTE